MSDTTEKIVPQQTDLTHQADEVSGRPSAGEQAPQGDRLTQEKEMFSLQEQILNKLGVSR